MKIICAAIKTQDSVIHILPRPYRHADIVHALHKAKQYKNTIIIAEGEQGFLGDDSEFYDRISAGKIAIESGQAKKLEFPPELYSEDLW